MPKLCPFFIISSDYRITKPKPNVIISDTWSCNTDYPHNTVTKNNYYNPELVIASSEPKRFR